MPIFDFSCPVLKCDYIEKDWYLKEGYVIKDYPSCPIHSCFLVKLFPTQISFNLKTSDLPYGFGEGYQPAFNKYCNSKREAMNCLKEVNQNEKDKAIEEGRSFKPFEWLPTDSKMEEDDKIRTEPGGEEYLTQQYKQKEEEGRKKRLEAKLEPIFNDLSF